MLPMPVDRFREPTLEAEYQAERRERLATLDMRSAVLFALLWLHDVWRFVGSAPLGLLLKATVWLLAVGLKPVYVCQGVGREFYKEWRSWIVAFTKVVFAVHPPGETLHLASLGVPAVPGTRAAPVLSALIGGLRLPYLLVTGVGWQDWLHNAPVQLALVVRAVRDNADQCAEPYFRSAPAQAVLRGLADRLTATLSSALYLGAGLREQQPAFPSGLDPCAALGAWAAACTFLLTTLALATSERRARCHFARRHAARLAPSEGHLAEDQGSGWAAWALAALLLPYVCLLAWQAVMAVMAWRDGRAPLVAL